MEYLTMHERFNRCMNESARHEQRFTKIVLHLWECKVKHHNKCDALEHKEAEALVRQWRRWERDKQRKRAG